LSRRDSIEPVWPGCAPDKGIVRAAPEDGGELNGFGDGLVVPNGDELVVPCGVLGFVDGVLTAGEPVAFGPPAPVGPLAPLGGAAVPLWVACWLITAWHNMHQATALLPMIVKSFIAILLVKYHPPARLCSNLLADAVARCTRPKSEKRKQHASRRAGTN
jgi:hypothetical protein